MGEHSEGLPAPTRLPTVVQSDPVSAVPNFVHIIATTMTGREIGMFCLCKFDSVFDLQTKIERAGGPKATSQQLILGNHNLDNFEMLLYQINAIAAANPNKMGV